MLLFFVQSYRGGLGNMYIMWCEDTNIYLGLRNITIDNIRKCLPKYFSMVHKANACALCENLIFAKLSAAEYRAIYAELTGDNSVANDYKTKEVDERMRVIMKNLTPGLAKDIIAENSIFEKFWDDMT